MGEEDFQVGRKSSFYSEQEVRKSKAKWCKRVATHSGYERYLARTGNCVENEASMSVSDSCWGITYEHLYMLCEHSCCSSRFYWTWIKILGSTPYLGQIAFNTNIQISQISPLYHTIGYLELVLFKI
jgi:hypothetical protein